MYEKWKKKSHKDITLPTPTSINTWSENTHNMSEESSNANKNKTNNAGNDFRKGFGKHKLNTNIHNNNRVYAEHSNENSSKSKFSKSKFGNKKGSSLNGSSFKQLKSNIPMNESPHVSAIHNKGIKSELKTKQELLKMKKIKANNDLKNMSKDKRKYVTDKMKQAKKQGNATSKKTLLASQRGGKKRSKVYVR